MATCQEVHDFLVQVGSKSAAPTFPPADLQRLAELGLVHAVDGAGFRQLQSDLQSLASVQSAVGQGQVARTQLAERVTHDDEHTHSVLFHLHGKDKQSQEIDTEARDRASLQALDNDLAQRVKLLNDLVAKRSLLDTLGPYGDSFVALTSLGQVEVRNLAVRLYRLASSSFDAYWSQSQKIALDFAELADRGAAYNAHLIPNVGDADRSYLWAVSIGLARDQPDLAVGVPRFGQAFVGLGPLAANVENRLMTAEILFALSQPIPDEVATLRPLVEDVKRLGVPGESALGVGAIFLFGRRGDGTFATPNLPAFLAWTPSYETAALLAIMNTPRDALAAKFQSLRAMFGGWGYEPSEDVELASAYLAVSEVPIDGVAAKLGILAKGLSTYLQYPLVAASILASVATLEANETLNLLEQAYMVVGRRTAGALSQAELITLAVRMVHSLRDELVGALDTTATVPVAGAPTPMIRPVFLPLIVAHNFYFSTYSGFSGAHPGHVHGFAGGGVGGGGGIG